jgi:hypothetical protein
MKLNFDGSIALQTYTLSHDSERRVWRFCCEEIVPKNGTINSCNSTFFVRLIVMMGIPSNGEKNTKMMVVIRSRSIKSVTQAGKLTTQTQWYCPIQAAQDQPYNTAV